MNRCWLFVSAFALPLFGQEAGEEPPPPVTFRVMAVGQTPPERFTHVTVDAETRKKEDEASGSRGFFPLDPLATGDSNDEGAAGKGVLFNDQGEPPPPLTSGLLMDPEDPDEYPPRPVYLATSNEMKPVFLWLTPGSTGQRIGLNRTPGMALFHGKDATGPFFSHGFDVSTTHLTVFLVAPPGQKNWDNFKTIEMDTSPSRLPPGSVMLINFSRTVIEGKIGSQSISVAPGSREKIPASAALNERGMVSLDLKNRGTTGAWMGLTRTARRLRSSDRLFLVAYHAISPAIPGQPTMVMTYADSGEPAKLREKPRE